MKSIPYSHQHISSDDIATVVMALTSDWLTQGPAVERFERALADYCGARHAVAVCNATAALHLACRALGLGRGETLWTSPNTFVASANCALYCGAGVDFVDIDLQTGNLSVRALKKKLEIAGQQGKLPKIVVPVHFGGQPCEMDSIQELSREYGFKVIEDAAHAVGARYKDSHVGSCRYSELTVFSFHPVKIITTGEGGMILTNHDDLASRMRLLRSHGITRVTDLMQLQPHGPWYYEQIALGYNYRLTDIQAALGYSQLQSVDDFVARRNYLAARYIDRLADLPVEFQGQAAGTFSAYHLFVIRIKAGCKTPGRREVFERLRQAGVLANVHYIPLHTQPFYAQFGFKRGDFPAAERYYEETITLPLFYGLTEEDQDRVIEVLRQILA